MLGVEPYLDGMARLLGEIETAGLANVRVLADDARLLLERLPAASLERIFVLFADPWPKKRHWKRRIVNPATVARMAELLVDGGELRVATDDPGYRRWILATLLAEQRLDWQVRGARGLARAAGRLAADPLREQGRRRRSPAGVPALSPPAARRSACIRGRLRP